MMARIQVQQPQEKLTIEKVVRYFQITWFFVLG
jgi:hypothetical protein